MYTAILPDKIPWQKPSVICKFSHDIYIYLAAFHNSSIHAIRERKVFYTILSASTGSFLDSDDYKTYSSPDIPEDATFGVYVSGDSMDPRYHIEKLIWIKQTEQLEYGEIGIFYLDGNVYVKNFQNNRKGTYLISLKKI
jgi:hypothetical protein